MKTNEIQQTALAGLAGLVLASGVSAQQPETTTMNIPYACVAETSLAGLYEGGDVEIQLQGNRLRALPAFGSPQRNPGMTEVYFKFSGGDLATGNLDGTQVDAYKVLQGPRPVDKYTKRPEVLGNDELSLSFMRADEAFKGIGECVHDINKPTLFPGS